MRFFQNSRAVLKSKQSNRMKSVLFLILVVGLIADAMKVGITTDVADFKRIDAKKKGESANETK